MEEIVTLNVGGQKHEIGRSLLNSNPGTRLASDIDAHLRPDRNEYFFDRNPQAFPAILHYLRSGELHAPRDLCGTVFQKELKYWGVDEHVMKECCWIGYSSDLQNRKNLSTFRRNHDDVDYVDDTKVKGKIWNFLNDEHSSKGAKVYAYLSIVVVLLSISVFCAGTVSVLQEDLHFDDFIYIYGPDVICDYGYDTYYAFYEECSENYPDYIAGTILEDTTAQLDDDTGATESTEKTKLLNQGLTHPILSLFIIDSICVGLFSLEYLLKLMCSPVKKKFLINPLNIIDLVAILPYFIELVVQYLRSKERFEETFVDSLYVLQILRIARLFKVLRYFNGLRIFMYTVRHSWKQMVLLLAFLTSGMVLFGSLIYYAEVLDGHTHITSIPHGFWWAIVTMTTVGYGDVAPKSNFGFFIGSICAIMGVLFIAFSVPILVQDFLLFYNFVHIERKTEKVRTTIPD